MTTKHKIDCKMAFGRKDSTCPRCQELLNGAKPKESWNARKDREYKQFTNYLKSQQCNHNNTNPGGYCLDCGKGYDFS